MKAKRMSLFSWLSPSTKAKSHGDKAGAGSAQEPRLVLPLPEGSPRKTERMARRELLYSVVRESMARAGVLSASYKFKVLSLDTAGRQFLVMVDLASSERLDADLLVDIESVIAQRAKTRHELTVSAVYWRRSDQVGAGTQRPAAGSHARVAATASTAPSQPAELASVPMPLQGAKAAAPVSAMPPAQAVGFDPIQDDEMEAFRAALANSIGTSSSAEPALSPPRRAAATRSHEDEPTQVMPRSSGFPDTQVREDDPRKRTLSSTQTGDLN
jgi:hypothetical protein